MLHYLIAIIDNTLPTLMALAVLLFFVRAGGGGRGAGLPGLALGALAALVYAVLKRNTGFAVREYYDLAVLGLSLALSVAMLPAAWAVFRQPKPLGLPGRGLSALLLAACSAYILPDVLLLPFTFSVGMENIYNTEFLFRVLGYGLGLLTMFLLGLGLYKIAGAMPRRLVLLGFSALLITLMAKQGLEVAQILAARNMIPRPPWLMSAIMFILTHSNWFAFVFMGIALAMTTAQLLRIRFTPLRGANPAMIRKQKAHNRAQRRFSGVILLCLVGAALSITILRDYDNKGVELSAPEEVPASNGVVVIPLERINDGNLHRFMHKSPSGVAIRYIVIKKTATAYGVGLDACDICGPSGYYQRKDQVVCILCDVVMNKATIGFPGGCNPVPLRFSIAEGAMRIKAADLDAEERRFK